MARKMLRKLIDIHDQAERLHAILERWLEKHDIEFERHHHQADGYYRYLVPVADLNAAQAVLPALIEISKGRRDHVS